ncbi:MAG: hypothetical protein LBV69_05855 [Bacteroidales bacterium]|jgi:hypothetical protein|nr:hypothetical protein [Bacteroidales bacterium]
MKIISYKFHLLIIITFIFLLNTYSQNSINIINKDVKILRKNTRFSFFSEFCPNKYIKIKVNGQILQDTIKSDNFTNYWVYILDENNNIQDYKVYSKFYRFYSCIWSLKYNRFIPNGFENEKKYEKKIEKFNKLIFKNKTKLIKYKKKYIRIKVPIRQRIWSRYNNGHHEYGFSDNEYHLERGKYYLYMKYNKNDTTYYSDTIPLYVW